MDYRNVSTTCVYCGVGCGLWLEVLDGEIVGVLPDKEHPVSRGMLCIKGWNAAAFVNHPDRLTVPLIRRGKALKEASWDEALSLVAEKLAKAGDKSGPDSVGFLASAKCTNEE
ncbi:MAG: formate dehydrogenase subunit alpha, partial [Anaerolineales bacterium]